MKFYQVMETVADAAINAGMLFRCFAYAILAFCIIAPITVAAL